MQEKETENRSQNGINSLYGCRYKKIVCRGSCRSGGCGRRDIVVFSSLEKALEAGYRPCVRCQPELEEWNGPKKRLILAAKEELENSYADKFSLKALAEKLYVNEDYLGRAFKAVVGITPLQYHNYVRCETARGLLEKPENSVEAVAYKVGYVSVSHFIKIFRLTYGETPLHYKKNRVA